MADALDEEDGVTVPTQSALPSNELPKPAVGSVIGPLQVTALAHGGHCVARWQDRVVFVRHAIPGEVVTAIVTDTQHARFWRADVVDVLESSADRVVPPCPIAGRCGGCDFQHVDLAAQRRLKAGVVAEQLQRLAGIERHVVVEAVPGDLNGLGYRTRMRYLVRGDRVGLRMHRSTELVELPASGCALADPVMPSVTQLRTLAGEADEAEVVVAASDSGLSVLVANRLVQGSAVVTQSVAGRQFAVRADGFWQVHQGAAEILTQVVRELAAPKPGERALDLFCGVGLFAAILLDARCEVVGVESDRRAIELAQRNVRSARFIASTVERALARLPKRVDLVVLDPPRSGAGRAVVQALVERTPSRIIYVACDPAALARDVATFAQHGYQLGRLRAIDLFPMTQHIECVAELLPS